MVYPFMGTTGLRLTGYTLQEVIASPKKHLELTRKMDQRFGADFVYPLDYGAILVETLELPMMYSEAGFPSVLDNPVKTINDIEILKIPDPYGSGIMSSYLEALQLMAGYFDKPLAVAIRGAFTMAVELVGATDFARAIICAPQFVEAVLDFCNRLVTDWARAVVQAGARFLCVSEPTAVILSPQRFEELVGRRLRRLFQQIPADTWRVLHICGDTSYLLPQMLNCGAEGLSLDQIMDLPQTALRVPEDVVILGNLDPVYVLREYDAVQVRKHTLDLLKNMKKYSNFIFSFGCDCTPDTPLENLRAAIDAAKTPTEEL